MCASFARIAEKGLRVRNCELIGLKSGLTIVNFVVIAESCGVIDATCEETFAIFAATGAMREGGRQHYKE
jgi:hypothetical protein